MSSRTAQSQQPEKTRITVLVNNKPLHLDEAIVEPQRLRDFVAAPDNYEVWKVVKSPDPEGELPVDDIQVTGPMTVESGNRFRVVPPGTFGDGG